MAVDLVIVRGGNEVLLGLRNNRPAQGFWFVPGGRILKNETIQTALLRIADKEFGLGDSLVNGNLKLSFHGAYEHMYEGCFAGDIGISTHYMELAHKVDVSANFALPMADDLHSELQWWPIKEALASNQVHQYIKNYL